MIIDVFYFMHIVLSMPYAKAEKLIRHVTLRQLQIFEAVVRLGSYTRAAETLFLTQPTVSMQVKKLSESLDSLLLEHANGHLQTTAAGRDVYETAQQILTKMVELGESIAEQDGQIKGELRIAAITSAKYFMPHLLASFIEQHPLVIPRLTIANRGDVVNRLNTHEDDLLIMGQAPDSLIAKAYPMLDHELVVVAHPEHPLSKVRNIPLQQLLQEHFLMREQGSGTRQAVEQLLAEHDLSIHPHMELGSSEAIKQAVMAKLGVSVISRYNLRLELAGNHIAVLDVEGFPLQRKWYAVHPRDKKLSMLSRSFLDYLLHTSM